MILQQRSEQPVGLFCLDGRPQLKSVHVAAPDLKISKLECAGGRGKPTTPV